MILNSLEPMHIAQYLELRKVEGAAIGGNRERAVLGSVISWGMRFGWCQSNPCNGRRRCRGHPHLDRGPLRKEILVMRFQSEKESKHG
jgi:hypothetical protein